MTGWLEARNILAIRLDNTGDVVMLGPALRAIKSHSPAAKLTLLAAPAGSAAAPLLPWVDDVITWRATWQDLGHLPFDPSRESSLVELLRRRRFDAALVFTSFSQSPHAAAYACLQAGIPLRAGHSKEFGGAVLTDWQRGIPDDLHQVERNLRLVESLGFVSSERDLAVRISDNARQEAREALVRAGIDHAHPVALVHPGASAAARRYPEERWAAVVGLLRAAGLQVIVTGVKREREIVEIAAANAAMALVDAVSLEGYAALVEAASVVLCGNTLPMHLADATGTPVVVCYSGTDLESQWQPRITPSRLLRRPTPCAPCYRFTCPIGQPCLDIPPSDVAAAALDLLDLPGNTVVRDTRQPRPINRQLRPAVPDRPQSIAIFQALGLGDLLCATPALEALRRRWLDARFTLIGQPWTHDLLGRIPAISEIIDFPGWPGIAETAASGGDPDALSRLQRQHFDIAIQFHGSGPQSNAFIASLDANVTAGLALPGDESLSFSLPWQPDQPEPSRWLDLTAALGAPRVPPRPILRPTPADEEGAVRLLATADDRRGPLIGLHAGAKDPRRRWPLDNFARLANLLADQAGATLVLTGGPGDRALTAAVQRRSGAPTLDLAGATSTGELAAVIARLDLLVTNDTGASHIAAAVGVPSLILFGPSPIARWAPMDRERHHPIDAAARRPDLPPDLALAALTPEAVLAEAVAMLAGPPLPILSGEPLEVHP
jgi:ADP-heptose:LPS heptosyltransferase